jgi:hypothetical protein
MDLVNKRQVLKPILDKVESGWSIKKPSPADPCDPDYLCIFQKPADSKEFEVSIPNELFDGPDRHAIEFMLRDAIKNRAKLIARSSTS